MAVVLDIVRPYQQLIKFSFRLAAVYRAAMFAGLVTNLFFGMLRAAVMIALYGQQTQVAGMTLQDAITYTGISQACIGSLNFFGWFGLIRSVHSGKIGVELLRPVGVFQYWLAQDFGRFLMALLLRTLPLMGAYALIYDIKMPQHAYQWAALPAALLFSWALSFTFSFLANLPAFWLPNAMGVARLAYSFMWFLSGFLMPLRFFSEDFQRLIFLTPFPHTINTIVEIYLGLLGPAEIAWALLVQVGWIVGLVGLSLLITRAGIRRLVILGG